MCSSPSGNNHARIPAEAFRRQKNAAVHRSPVFVHLHFYQDLSKRPTRVAICCKLLHCTYSKNLAEYNYTTGLSLTPL